MDRRIDHSTHWPSSLRRAKNATLLAKPNDVALHLTKNAVVRETIQSTLHPTEDELDQLESLEDSNVAGRT